MDLMTSGRQFLAKKHKSEREKAMQPSVKAAQQVMESVGDMSSHRAALHAAAAGMPTSRRANDPGHALIPARRVHHVLERAREQFVQEPELKGEAPVVLRLSALAAVINLAFDLLVVGRYGVPGVALTTALSFMLVMTLGLIQLRRTLSRIGREGLG